MKKASCHIQQQNCQAKEEMKEWDQFKVNEERFGVKSTYKEAHQAEVWFFLFRVFTVRTLKLS